MNATTRPPGRTRLSRVQGRDFRLALTLDTTTGLLRVAVTDAKGEQLPVVPADSATDGETGRGLLMVGALADRWGTEPHPPGGKTVWAEVSHRSG